MMMHAISSAIVLLAAQVTSRPTPRPEWQAQLDQVASEVAEVLTKLPNLPRKCGRHGLDAAGVFLVVEHWPHPRFRPALVRLLDDTNANIVVNAACALLPYDDRELHARIEELARDDRRVGPELRFTIGQLVLQAIKESVEGSRARVRSAPTLVRLNEDGDVNVWDCGFATVPDALAALGDGDLSIRLQAFLWLGAVGIVVDTSALDEAWPRVPRKARASLLETLANVHWGRDALRTSLEQILDRTDRERLPDRALGALLSTLIELGSARVREPSLRTIEALIRAGAVSPKDEEDDDRIELLCTAFRAFASTATSADVDRCLQWTESPRAVVRFGGLFVLACLDDPPALAAVTAFIQSNREPPGAASLLDPYRALASRTWKSEATKCAYTRVVLDTLDRQVRAIPASAAWYTIDYGSEERSPDEHVETLEAMTCVSNGPTGRVRPPRAMIELKVLRETLSNWHVWLSRRDECGKGDVDRTSTQPGNLGTPYLFLKRTDTQLLSHSYCRRRSTQSRRTGRWDRRGHPGKRTLALRVRTCRRPAGRQTVLADARHGHGCHRPIPGWRARRPRSPSGRPGRGPRCMF